MVKKTAKKTSPKKKVGAEKDRSIIDDIAGLVRTSVFAGLGLAFLGEEKLEEWAKKIARENNLSTKDMKSFLRDLKKQGRDAREDVEKRVKTLIDDIVSDRKKK